jgi:tetratricopeptide (TPR) repeat protein/peroxiredoxin
LKRAKDYALETDTAGPSAGSRRRNFLTLCWRGVSAAVMSSAFPTAALSFFRRPDSQIATSPDGRYYVHPRFQSRTPLDDALLKAKKRLESFGAEKHCGPIHWILDEWSAALRASPQSVDAIGKALTPAFSGCSLKPLESRSLRSGPTLEVARATFRQEPALSRDAFLQELRHSLSVFSKILTAEFQVTRIEALAQPRSGLATRVRYEFVGTGRDFHREQRVGFWDLEWETDSSGSYLLQRWVTTEETRSRGQSQFYSDVTRQTLGGNSSYAQQLLHGVDYWRTVLDGASGIDIYGHNGVSVGDIDGDGFDDLYVCQPAGLPNRLYRNRGDGTFEDITEASGVGILENTACAIIADFDNDGRQDLVVVRANGPLLFLNQGGGKFRMKPDAFQFANAPQGTFTGAAAADYNRDGLLDIYFCLYVYYQGTDQYKYPVPYYDANNGPPNFLMRNSGDGTFRDVTAESGLNQNNTRYSFCCGWNDYNQDGWPDLYVVNDFGRKNLYRNRQGQFTDVAPQAGVEDTGAGMSVCCFDHNNDGLEDLYVADMWTAAGERISREENFQKGEPASVRAAYRKHAMGNSLYKNGGKGSFEDETAGAGVGMGRWAWSSDAWDFDHDGFPDIYVANGMVSGPLREDLNSFFWREVVANSPNEVKFSADYEQGWAAVNELLRTDQTWSGYERNVFYVNNRNGTFSDISGVVGLDFSEDGRSFALADFDHDGRQELCLKNRNAPQLRLLKNVMTALPPAIAFQLRGTKSNRDAIGATVTVETGVGRQTRTLQAGSGFLSQNSKEIFFGLGEAKGNVTASIRWPSGLIQRLDGLPMNHRIFIEEGAAVPRMEPFKDRASSVDAIEVFEPSEEDRLPTSVETWLLVPVSAPGFSLPDLTGETRSLSSLRGRPVLLTFWVSGSSDCLKGLRIFDRSHAAWFAQGLEVLAINLDDAAAPENLRVVMSELGLSLPVVCGSAEVAGVYDILYRYLFDRRRDLTLPTSFLLDDKGDIVKVYQGPIRQETIEQDFKQIPKTASARLAKALPFPGVADTFEFGRNYLSYGSVFFQRGYLGEAAESFQLAARADPSSAEAQYGIGSVYLKQEKIREARESFSEALKRTASYPDTRTNSWNNLGLIAAREGKTVEAIGYFHDALRLNPEHFIALENLGNAYRQEKRWDEALTALQKALAINPDDPEANYSLGMVFAQTDQTESAYQSLRKALQYRPDYPEALNNLGVLYLRTGHTDEAIAKFEQSIQVAPLFDQSYLNLARVYQIEGALDKARAVLLQLLKERPDHVQAQQALAQLK